MATTPDLFPTYVVGSLPRPQWVRDLIEDRKAGSITPGDAEKVLDEVVPSAIRMQERTGIDFISDGEWRRESYVKVFTDAVDGFTPDLVSSGGTSAFTHLWYPAVTSKIRLRRPIALDEATFLRSHTNSKVIVAVPSPYTVARRMWHPDHSTGAYATREEFMEACIPIINGELHRLAAAGVDAIQLDDPWLALLVDPKYRESSGITDIDHEMALSVRGVNGAVQGIAGVPISVHLCHAHFARAHGTKGPYDLIIGVLSEMNVARFAMEFATPDAGGIKVLRDFPADKTLGLGVIDHTDPNVETPEIVASRVEAAMEYVPKERLSLNPDCGFSPSSVNPMDFDEAYLKLRSLGLGARLLRERYG
ncbi:MAG: cobalamin-independent methionine synthase II family protein [SAR202 cluster bacterium]|nr:cobalamin-independent methionine synthase II family protein [SAR202 cluster bacterium]